MTRALAASLMFLFSHSPSSDVVAYPCTVWARSMVPLPPEAPCGRPPCLRISDPVPVPCTVIPSDFPDADFEAHIAGDIPPGWVAFGCVAAEDTAGNRSECIGWSANGL